MCDSRRAERAKAFAAWDKAVYGPADEAVAVWGRRLTVFLARTRRPTAHAVVEFGKLWVDDLHEILKAVSVRRWSAAIAAGPLPGRPGRPRTRPVHCLLGGSPLQGRGRPVEVNDDAVIVAKVTARLSAAGAGRQSSRAAVLVDVLHDEILQDPVRHRRLKNRRSYHEENLSVSDVAQARRVRRALEAAVKSVEGTRFKRLARRVSRAVRRSLTLK